MAVTKIHAIKLTVGKAIKYICNPHKTDDKVLVSSFGCSPETADLEFDFTLSHTRNIGSNKAFHLIQSFMPGEVDPEEANRIGQELAELLLQGKYSYVLATHIDKNHIHNHIIFCATDNIKHNKYHDCKQSYYHIRDISDRLCYAHHKSVIIDFLDKGKSYTEWQSERKGTSWKSQIRRDINDCIRGSLTYDEFLKKMRDKGYEIEGEAFGPDAPKYISFRPPGKDRFVRGRDRSLGKEYTKERIRERIEEKTKIRAEKMNSNSTSRTGFVDTSDAKFAENPGLDRWAKLENLKRFANMYAELGRLGLQSPEDLTDRISLLKKEAQAHKHSAIQLERKIRDFSEVLHYAKQYAENKRYGASYQKSRDPDRYYRMHQDQLTLYWSAKNILEKMGIDLQNMNVDEIEKHYETLCSDFDKMRSLYRSAKDEYNNLIRLRNNLRKYMSETQEEQPAKNIKREL